MRTLTTYADVRDALQRGTSAYGSLEAVLGRTMVSVDGDEHARLRGGVFAAIRGPGMKGTVDRVVCAYAWGDDLEGVPARVMTELLGYPSHRWRELREIGTTLLAAVTRDEGDNDALVKAFYARKELLRLTDGDVEECDRAGLLLLSGGDILVRSLLALRANQRAYPGFTFTQAWPETLRLAAPFPVVVRMLDGEPVVLRIDAANRDPGVYASPNEYLPGRHGPPHLAFAPGAHVCVGQHLARVIAEAVFNRG